jgi:hypothetical protein
MAFYKDFPYTPYMPNPNSVCDRGDFFAKRNIIAFPAISELAVRFVPSGPKFYSNLSTTQGQQLRIFLLSPLDVVFFKDFYNVTTWISNRSL